MGKFKPEVRDFLLDILLTRSLARTKDQLVLSSGYARSTIQDHLTKLMIEGKIVKRSKVRATRGRPEVYYLSPDCSSILSKNFV